MSKWYLQSSSREGMLASNHEDKLIVNVEVITMPGDALAFPHVRATFMYTGDDVALPIVGRQCLGLAAAARCAAQVWELLGRTRAIAAAQILHVPGSGAVDVTGPDAIVALSAGFDDGLGAQIVEAFK